MSSSPTLPLPWPADPPVLVGEGLVLRPWRDADADAVYEACQDPAIQRWTTVPSPYRRPDAEGFVGDSSRSQWSSQQGASFCVTTQADDEVVLASCGLVSIDPVNLVAEAGYWVARSARGAGVASRANRVLAAWALSEGGLHRLELYVDPDNTASRSAAEASGASFEGILRSKALVRGERRDMALYALAR